MTGTIVLIGLGTALITGCVINEKRETEEERRIKEKADKAKFRVEERMKKFTDALEENNIKGYKVYGDFDIFSCYISRLTYRTSEEAEAKTFEKVIKKIIKENGENPNKYKCKKEKWGLDDTLYTLSYQVVSSF